MNKCKKINSFNFENWLFLNKKNIFVQKAINHLSINEKKIIRLYIFNKKNFSEISVLLGIPIDSTINIFNDSIYKIKNILIMFAYDQ